MVYEEAVLAAVALQLDQQRLAGDGGVETMGGSAAVSTTPPAVVATGESCPVAAAGVQLVETSQRFYS